MLPPIPFYMIRHGQSEANLGQFTSGHVDVPLTPKGLEQAQDAAKIVAALDIKPSLIIHSNLQRARITAEIINEGLGLPMIEDREIAEQNFGDWEGKSWTITRQPIHDGIDPPNGESHQTFYNRVKDTITRHVNANEQSAPIMFVCHGGVFRALGSLYGKSITGIANCSLHSFHPDGDEAAIAFPWKMRNYA